MKMDDELLMSKMRALIEKEQLLEGATGVLCALSGGADSTALFFALKEICKQRNIAFAAAHLNHCLRGEESLRDEQFVKTLCDRFSVPLEMRSADIAGLAKERSKSIELCAREVRYEFLKEAEERLQCNRIATAHTASDQAETVLHRLIRGSGADGLCGIPIKRGEIIRPLLEVSREEVEEFLAKRSESYITDSTNVQLDYTRNRIRQKIIPLCKEENPAFLTSVTHMTEALKKDCAALAQWAKDAAETAVSLEGRVSLAELSALPEAIQVRLLCLAAARAGVGELSYLHRRALLEVCEKSQTGSGCTLSKGFRGVCRYGILCFEKESYFAEPIMQPLLMGENILPDGSIVVAELATQKLNNLDNTLYLDYDKITGKLFLRSRKSGDEIHAVDSVGRRSLKKLYIDRKIEAPRRPAFPILCDDKGICWSEVAGVDVRVAIDSETTQYLKISVRRTPDE